MTKVFSLRGRALKLDTAEDLAPHIKPLLDTSSGADDLEEIHLEGNTIGVGAAESLASILATKTSLRVANLADIFTGRLLSEIPPALDALLTALRKCPRLHTVNLNDNAFGLNTVEPLRPFLAQHVPLQHLYLNNNGLGPAAGALVAESLVELAAAKDKQRSTTTTIPDLETIVCGRNRLETGSMAAWAKAYTAHARGMRVVKMVQNGIRPDGVATLLRDGLAHCKALETLDLQDNTFTQVAATALAQVLPGWAQIRDLGVGDCLVGAKGGVALGRVLGKGGNVKVEVLRLQFNEIDAKGVKALREAAEGDKALPRLRRVELNGNKFEEEDADVERLREILAERKEAQAASYEGVDEDDEDAWGIDELDELEEDDDEEDEEEEDEEEAEEEAKEEKVVKEADAAEAQPVAAGKDKDVDDLADALGKTSLK